MVTALGLPQPDEPALDVRAANGFLDLLPAGATGVKVTAPRWSEGDLTIVVRDLLGLRLPNGRFLLVAPYVKDTAPDQESADILPYLLESVVDDVLPGATPVVWDTRRRTSSWSS